MAEVKNIDAAQKSLAGAFLIGQNIDKLQKNCILVKNTRIAFYNSLLKTKSIRPNHCTCMNNHTFPDNSSIHNRTGRVDNTVCS